MKLITSISLSMLFLFQGMGTDMDMCEQLEKISNFITHYQEHKVYDGDSFFEFIVEDYFNDDGDKEGLHDGSEKDKVPNHTHHQCCHPVVFIANSNSIEIKAHWPESKSQFDHYTSQFNSRFLESLFQPPRV